MAVMKAAVFLSLCATIFVAAAAPVRIDIDCGTTLRSVSQNPTGFCMSFVDDADRDGRQSLGPLLKSMGVGSLRYPMGTLAENYLFHDLRQGPPVEGALQPRVITMKKPPANWKAAVNPDGGFSAGILDFDEYIAMCKTSGAAPVIMVASHGHLYPGSEFSEEDIVRNAEEWVRYANVTRKLGIRYWEIGNEVDLRKVQQTMPREEYLRLYRKMATRMKQVDPSIRTGLGTMYGKRYAAEALKEFPALVDFIVTHHYLGRVKDLTQYAGMKALRLDSAVAVLQDIDEFAPPERRASTEVLITEFSSYCAGTKNVPEFRQVNSVFNAMLTFDMLATGISMDERVRFMHFWVTHSPWGARNPTNYANAFDRENEVLPQGRAIELLGRFLRERMVGVQCPAGPVRVWAGASGDASKVTVWLINRAQEETDVSIELAGFKGASPLASWALVGESPHDPKPAWGRGEQVGIEQGRVAVTLPPFSITVLHSP